MLYENEMNDIIKGDGGGKGRGWSSTLNLNELM